MSNVNFFYLNFFFFFLFGVTSFYEGEQIEGVLIIYLSHSFVLVMVKCYIALTHILDTLSF